MANKRVNYPIPANTWVLILAGGTTATFYMEKTDVSYISMLYDSAVDDPNVSIPLPAAKPDTGQRIFTDGLIEEFEDSTNTWYWVYCKDGKTGEIISTP